MGQSELQREIVEKSLDFFKNNKIGYLDVAMRVGKSFISIEIFRKLGKNILISYPDNKLKDSWSQEFQKWNYINDKVTFVNFSSLKKYLDNSYDVFCIDEWHSLSLQELEYCKEISEKCNYTLGLSGTISKETKMKWPNLKEIFKFTTNQAIDSGVVSDYQITVHIVELDNKIRTPNKQGKLKTEKERYKGYSYVMANTYDKKSKMFMHLALARNRLSLSSIGKIQYTKKLLVEKMQQKRVLIFTGLADVADQFPFSYHSKSKNDENYQSFLKGEINWLSLAAMGKVGVTYPNLDSVILLNFTYNAAETSQILNRAIKLDYKGKIADLHVIVLNEEPELKKVKESLSMLDQSKIKYIKN